MVAAFDYTLHGKGGAAPSIDTAMHGLVDAAHVDHLHPDSGIAIATAADGEELTAKIFGGTVVWVPWRRPGFQLGLDIAAIKRGEPGGDRHASSAATASPRGATPARRPRRTRCGSSTPPPPTSPSTAGREPFGAPLDGYEPLARGRAPREGRRPRPAPARDRLDRPRAGRPLHRRRRRARLPRLRPSTRASPRSAPAAPTTSCAPRSSRSCSTCRPTPPSRTRSPASRSCTSSTAPTTRPTTTGTRPPTPPRSAAPTRRSCSIPGVGMFRYGANKQTARVAGEFYINAINVMRGAEALSTYAPIDEAEKFRIEYWALEEAKLQRMPKPKPLATRIALVTGRRIRHRQGHRHPARRRGRVRRHRRPRPREGAGRRRRDRRHRRRRSASQANVTDEAAVQAGDRRGAARLRRPRPRRQQRRPVAVEAAARDHRRRLGPAAQRDGEGLVPRLAGRREGAHRPEARRRHRLHLVEELGVRRARTTSRTRRRRPTRRTRCDCWPPSSASTACSVNGINPDGVVRGSGIFAGGWGAKRAAVYGVPEEELGQVLRPAHAAEARGAARERGQRGVRAAARATSTTPPACTSPSTPGVAAAFLR